MDGIRPCEHIEAWPSLSRAQRRPPLDDPHRPDSAQIPSVYPQTQTHRRQTDTEGSRQTMRQWKIGRGDNERNNEIPTTEQTFGCRRFGFACLLSKSSTSFTVYASKRSFGGADDGGEDALLPWGSAETSEYAGSLSRPGSSSLGWNGGGAEAP